MKALTKLPIIPIITVLLGAVLLTEFYTHLALGDFTASGFTEGVNSVAKLDNAPYFWKLGLVWVGQNSTIFAPLSALFLIVTSACLILLLFRKISLWITTAIFALYWVSLWNHPGIWIFEFLFPLSFAFCAAAASSKEGALGSKLFGNMKSIWRYAIVLSSSVALWYVITLGKNAGEKTALVACLTALTFAVLFGLCAWIDFRRKETPKETKWVDIMVLIVGAMMVLQVFADQAVGFYTTEGYAGLVRLYAAESSCPAWYKAFLSWSGDYAFFLMPAQAIFEAAVAILLTLLIFRGPALLLTALMFVVFTYAEFGVKAELPDSPIHTLTNTWELLFVTVASLFISVKQTAQMFQAPTWKEKALGDPLFGSLNMFRKCIIALLAGVALFGAGMATHVFCDHYERTSWLGAISFTLLLIINGYIDRYRVYRRPNQ